MLVYSFEILEGEKVFINNGVVSYMFDSFKWIKTFNKLRTRRNKGLFYGWWKWSCNENHSPYI